MIQKNRGLLGYYGLYDWWSRAFTVKEREYIIDSYNNTPILGNKPPLFSGNISGVSRTPISFISELVSLLNPKNDIVTIEKIIEKGEEIADFSNQLIDRHFFYSTCGEVYYKLRDVDATYYEKAKNFFLRQIDINVLVFKAMVREYGKEKVASHKGFKQMAIIYEKEKRFTDAINLCKSALKTGWRGDWVERIEKLEGKTKKS